MHVDLDSVELKSYLETVGPGLARPTRPSRCPACNEGLNLQRTRRAACAVTWTLHPTFLYPHRSFAPDVAEAGALAYLRDQDATYERTAKAFVCSACSVRRWVGWIAHLITAALVLTEVERLPVNDTGPLPVNTAM